MCWVAEWKEESNEPGMYWCEVRRGSERRQDSEKRGESESRIQTAKATVSSGRAARVSSAWMCVVEGARREREGGMRFVRWIAGPVIYVLLA